MDKMNTLEVLEVLEKFLELEFSSYKLDDNEKKYLVEYSIIKERGSNNILDEIYGKGICTNDKYLVQRENLNQVKIRLQDLYDKYNKPLRKDGFQSFKFFLMWWCSKKGECFYCGIDEETSKKAFEEKIFEPKKNAWKNGILQIEKRIPQKGYIPENCELACVLCNNAKSDLISDEDFLKYFKTSMKKYWVESVICKLKQQTQK